MGVYDEQFIKPAKTSRDPWNNDRSTSFLDGLRGLAAFIVLVYHFNVGWYGEEILHGYGDNGHRSFTLLPFVRIFYSGGPAAVAIFFVLSGFVLTISPLRQIRDRKPSKQIYQSLLSSVVRRPIRLYLPCLLFVLTTATLRHTPLIPQTPWPVLQGDVFLEVITAISKFTTFFYPLRQHNVMIPFEYGVHYWTIPIELKGSMLVFTLVALSAKGASPKWELLRLLFMGILFHQMGQWAMSLFMFGMCLAICEANHFSLTDLSFIDAKFGKYHSELNWTILLLGGWLCSQVDRDINWSLATPGWYLLTRLTPTVYVDDEYFRFWNGYGAALIVYAVLRIKMIQDFFKLRVLTWLGKISFVLYLSHTVVFSIVGEVCKRLVGQATFFIPGELGTYWYDNKLYMPDVGPMGLNLRWFGSFALCTSCCLVFAHFGTRIYDHTGVRAARWLSRSLALDKPVAAPLPSYR
ncbi:MAG: hypothetical protein GOMPHAMPRED_008107 [Gomphillus americanus]|uniref:Acyltransferase 3 domain-containing protein n=1 Tax=Gomphillus americanus TaxID=1940652 RepID=A0A8H3IHV1_9LECA|nr:MAG: hypothetical protein GOMPHAMPRED_008107 [Gomphillus americanus]